MFWRSLLACIMLGTQLGVPASISQRSSSNSAHAAESPQKVERDDASNFPNRASKELVSAALPSAAKFFEQFDEAAEKINFSEWEGSYKQVNSARLTLEQLHKQSRDGIATIRRISASGHYSASDLFLLYTTLASVSNGVALFSQGVTEYQKNYVLGGELSKVSASGSTVVTTLGTALELRLIQDELELTSCQAASN